MRLSLLPLFMLNSHRSLVARANDSKEANVTERRMRLGRRALLGTTSVIALAGLARPGAAQHAHGAAPVSPGQPLRSGDGPY
jgi:hypothetical protein